MLPGDKGRAGPEGDSASARNQPSRPEKLGALKQQLTDYMFLLGSRSNV